MVNPFKVPPKTASEALREKLSSAVQLMTDWYEQRLRDSIDEMFQFLVRLLLPIGIVILVYAFLKPKESAPAVDAPIIIPHDFRFPLPLSNAFHSNPAGLAGICVLIAFLTSAFIQLLKTGIRARAHRASLDQWLDNRLRVPHLPAQPDSLVGKESDNASEVSLARQQIEELCAADATGPNDFYALPTAQFCGQIGSAVDLVMIEPDSFQAVYAALTSGTRPEHLSAVWEFFKMAPNLKSGEKENGELDRYDRLRTRIINYAQRALDSLQLEATHQWKHKLMIASIQASVGISAAVVLIVSPPGSKVSELTMFAYSTAVCAGAGALLAPLAYDLISSIRALGQR